ncbi:MAG: anti-sigma factor family protein [Chitinophagaceae bacterium]
MSSEHQHNNTSIHLGNYEEFFLLYIDQELSELERKNVEYFLDQHPELQEEMQQLILTKCKPEKMPPFDKSGLFKNHVDVENAEALQLLLIDDELDQETTAALHEYMSENPESLTNFQILLQTKLQHEEVIFPDKEILLKKNNASILTFRRISIAVAASLILLMGIRFLISQDPLKVNSSDLIVSKESTIKNSMPYDVGYTKSDVLSNEKNSIPTVAKSIRKIHQKPLYHNKKMSFEKDDSYLMAQDLKTPDQSSTEQLKNTTVKSNNLPVRENISNGSINAEPKQSYEQVSVLNESVKDNYATDALTNITPVSYREDEENDQEREGIKKFIRKANRLYNRVTHPEPDKTIIRFAKREIGIPR